MSLATLTTDASSLDVLSASLDLRLAGVPLYRIELDADEAPSGPVELVFATGPAFRGTVARATAFEGRVELVVVGGSGGLSLEPELAIEVGGAGYTGTPIVVEAALILGDLLALSGDALSPDVDLESFTLPRWQRVADYAGRALGLLAAAWGASWRIRADGLLWIGSETWEAYEDESNVIEQGNAADTAELSAALTVDRPDIAPGMTVGGRRVERVVYTLAGDSLRARLTYQTSQRGGDLASALRATLGQPSSLYAGTHLGRVVQQRADGTLDLIPDTVAVGGLTGINRVPLRVGLAGAKQTLEVGTIVALRFASSSTFPLGDPRLPYAESLAMVDADRGIARQGDKATIGTLLATVVTVPAPALQIALTLSGSPYGSPADPIVLLFPGASVVSGITPGVPYAVDAWIATGSPEISLRRLDTEEID